MGGWTCVLCCCLALVQGVGGPRTPSDVKPAPSPAVDPLGEAMQDAEVHEQHAAMTSPEVRQAGHVMKPSPSSSSSSLFRQSPRHLGPDDDVSDPEPPGDRESVGSSTFPAVLHLSHSPPVPSAYFVHGAPGSAFQHNRGEVLHSADTSDSSGSVVADNVEMSLLSHGLSSPASFLNGVSDSIFERHHAKDLYSDGSSHSNGNVVAYQAHFAQKPRFTSFASSSVRRAPVSTFERDQEKALYNADTSDSSDNVDVDQEQIAERLASPLLHAVARRSHVLNCLSTAVTSSARTARKVFRNQAEISKWNQFKVIPYSSKIKSPFPHRQRNPTFLLHPSVKRRLWRTTKSFTTLLLRRFLSIHSPPLSASMGLAVDLFSQRPMELIASKSRMRRLGTFSPSSLLARRGKTSSEFEPSFGSPQMHASGKSPKSPQKMAEERKNTLALKKVVDKLKRPRRSLENTNMDEDSAAGSSDENAVSAADLGAMGGSVQLLSGDATADVTTGLDHDVTSAHCGRGGNWSCRGRCGHAPSLPCSCHALCELTEHCCEDYPAECPSNSSNVTSSDLSAFRGRRQACRKGHMMISDCPDQWAGTEVDGRCRRERPGVVDEVSPVSDAATGVVFANAHCAECHGVSDLVEWGARADCRKIPLTFSELYARCRLHFVPPDDYPAQKCFADGDVRYSSTCPARSVKDSLLEEKCGQFHSYVVTPGLDVFKNIYCLKCLFPTRTCLEGSSVSSFLEELPLGNFEVYMNWSVGAETTLSAKRSEEPEVSWLLRCNASGHCRYTSCPDGQTILLSRYCVPNLFDASASLHFSAALNSTQTNDLLALLPNISPFLDARGKVCSFFKSFSWLDRYGSVVTVEFRCRAKAFLKIEEGESSRLLPVPVEQLARDLYEKDYPNYLWKFCVLWVPQNVVCHEFSKPRPQGMKSAAAERRLGLTGSSLSLLALSLRMALRFCLPHFRFGP